MERIQNMRRESTVVQYEVPDVVVEERVLLCGRVRHVAQGAGEERALVVVGASEERDVEEPAARDTRGLPLWYDAPRLDGWLPQLIVECNVDQEVACIEQNLASWIQQ